MTLPLTPTIEPQLAKTATELPPEGAWLYEPKWDGFRVIAFVDGDEVFLQSRNGKPLDRYFPELTLPPGRYVLDGEIVIDPGDGSQDFGDLRVSGFYRPTDPGELWWAGAGYLLAGAGHLLVTLRLRSVPAHVVPRRDGEPELDLVPNHPRVSQRVRRPLPHGQRASASACGA